LTARDTRYRCKGVAAIERLFWVLLWIVGIGIVGLVIAESESFTDCIHNTKTHKEYQVLHENDNTISSATLRFLIRERLQAACAADFADKNERAISALAAVALALFTLYLWRATRGLRHFAGIQARDVQRLLEAANINATAAASQAEAMTQLHAAAIAQAEATKGLLEHTPQIERAYISCGISRHMTTIESGGGLGAYQIIQPKAMQVYSGHCILEVSNHGKTKGVLLQYAITFVDVGSVPDAPV